MFSHYSYTLHCSVHDVLRTATTLSYDISITSQVQLTQSCTHVLSDGRLTYIVQYSNFIMNVAGCHSYDLCHKSMNINPAIAINTVKPLKRTIW